jgi:hypothetical protein
MCCSISALLTSNLPGDHPITTLSAITRGMIKTKMMRHRFAILIGLQFVEK